MLCGSPAARCILVPRETREGAGALPRPPLVFWRLRRRRFAARRRGRVGPQGAPPPAPPFPGGFAAGVCGPAARGQLAGERWSVGPAGPTPQEVMWAFGPPGLGLPLCGAEVRGTCGPHTPGIETVFSAMGALRPPAFFLVWVSPHRPPGYSFSRERVPRTLGGGIPRHPQSYFCRSSAKGSSPTHPSRQRLGRLRSRGPRLNSVPGYHRGCGRCRSSADGGASHPPPTWFLLGCSFGDSPQHDPSRFLPRVARPSPRSR